jgi:vacuolar-type H+-ATPase subunit C/Vma6
MAEAERLDALCALHSLPELAQAIHSEGGPDSAVPIQRHSVERLVGELSGLRSLLDGAGADLLEWILVRFQMENLKVLLRACVAKAPEPVWRESLVALPRHLDWNAPALAAAGSPAAFTSLLPRGSFRKRIEKAWGERGATPRLFFLEAALDRFYFEELLARVERLTGDGVAAVVAMVQQEADIFHLMLVARGRFDHGLPAEQLRSLHIPGTQLPRARFAAMLRDPDPPSAMRRALGRVLDELPRDRGAPQAASTPRSSDIEALAWNRFRRLANRAFRQGPVGVGAVFGYTGLRRLEAANLITVSEGLRLGLEPVPLRARLIPRGSLEVAHV